MLTVIKKYSFLCEYGEKDLSITACGLYCTGDEKMHIR